jgi:PTS hybrid protein
VIALLLVGHLQVTASGVEALVQQLTGASVVTAAVGGQESPGADWGRLAETVRTLLGTRGAETVVALGDLGSSLILLDQLAELPDFSGRLRVVDAPFLEGAVAAAMAIAIGSDVEEVVEAAESAYVVRKR